MVFLTYDFVAFALVFFSAYLLIPKPRVRLFLIVFSSIGFLWLYGGLTSVLVIGGLSVISFLAGRRGTRSAIAGGVAACVGSLLLFKYDSFVVANIGGLGLTSIAAKLALVRGSVLPEAVPLGVSFFTFEFIHYLVDVRNGRPPIRRVTEFLGFGLFWPTMVAGPIKRFEQFVPAMERGLETVNAVNVAEGLLRVAVGLSKKWVADNLTGWIDFIHPQYSSIPQHTRWMFIAAISARILLDFSGYSDIAIGFARMLGIRVPENFNWPYLARSPAQFWQRWHMSLSSWIRDYIYIPLGGNRLGTARRVANGLTAMILCGLWHGPSWNFAVWGLYHGCGLAGSSMLGRRRAILKPDTSGPGTAIQLIVTHGSGALAWAGTIVFVCLGWLLFFYPLNEACWMALFLFRR